jgi:hypothetical protein
LRRNNTEFGCLCKSVWEWGGRGGGKGSRTKIETLAGLASAYLNADGNPVLFAKGTAALGMVPVGMWADRFVGANRTYTNKINECKKIVPGR